MRRSRACYNGPVATYPSTTRMLLRGAAKRCARCGTGGLFRRWFVMRERCPSCGLQFADEDGYWLGAMMINTAMTFAVFVVVLLAGLIVTWPDPPVVPLVIVVVAVNAVVPIIGYPFSKTLWVAMERAFRRATGDADEPGYAPRP